jgi:hypothetical protein
LRPGKRGGILRSHLTADELKESTMTARVLALTICLSWLSREAPAAFRFQIPDGFRDLSPGVPDASFAGLPDTIVQAARSGKFAAYGMDFREEDGFYENFNALIQSGALQITEDFVRGHRAESPAEYSKLMGGAEVAILEHGMTTLGGVTVLRAVYDIKTPEISMRQMQYMVPGGNSEWAVLTYSATPSTFDRYLPAFEASAAATSGLAEAKLVDFWRAGKWGIYGAVIGLVVALVAQLAKKGKKAPARPVPRRMPPRPTGRR